MVSVTSRENGVADWINRVEDARADLVRRAVYWSDVPSDVSRIRALFRAVVAYRKISKIGRGPYPKPEQEGAR